MDVQNFHFHYKLSEIKISWPKIYMFEFAKWQVVSFVLTLSIQSFFCKCGFVKRRHLNVLFVNIFYILLV